MLDAANYTISGPGAGDRVTPDNVAYVNGQSYDLTWSNGSFERAEMLTVTASQAIEDAGGDPIVAPLSAAVYVPDGNWQFVGGSTGLNGPGSYPDENDPGKVLQPGARVAPVTWTDGNGDLWLFGGRINTAQGNGYLNDLWKYEIHHDETDPSAGQWVLVSGTGNYLRGNNTYQLTWTAGQFAAGQPLVIHVDDEHILDLVGDLLGAPNFITLMIPFDAPGCICPTP